MSRLPSAFVVHFACEVSATAPIEASWASRSGPVQLAMAKHQVVVLRIVAGQLSVSEAARQYKVSRQYPRRLLGRYRQRGRPGWTRFQRTLLSKGRRTSEAVSSELPNDV